MQRSETNQTVSLSASTVFVGGPIQYAIEPGGFHSHLQEVIELAIRTLRADGISVLSAQMAEQFGALTHEFFAKAIWCRDRQ